MGFIAAKCPQCGAELMIEDSRDYYYCSYCGSKIIHEEQLSKFPSVSSLTTLGFRDIECKDDATADKHFDEALRIDPNDTGAIIGKTLVGRNQRLFYFNILKKKYPSISDMEKNLLNSNTALYFIRTYTEGEDKERLNYVLAQFLETIIGFAPDFFAGGLFYGNSTQNFHYSDEMINYIIQYLSSSGLSKEAKLLNIFGDDRHWGLFYSIKNKFENKKTTEIIKNNNFSPNEVFSLFCKKAITGPYKNFFSTIQLPLFVLEELLQIGLNPHTTITTCIYSENGYSTTEMEFYIFINKMVQKKRVFFGYIETKKRTQQYDKEHFKSTEYTPEDYLSLLEKYGYKYY